LVTLLKKTAIECVSQQLNFAKLKRPADASPNLLMF